MVEELEADNLHEMVAAHDKVIVQYSASWCGNCRIMKPKFKKMAAENPGAVFVIADAEKYAESRKLAKVDNLPTFAAFERGQLIGQTQTNKAEVLKELVDEITSN